MVPPPHSLAAGLAPRWGCPLTAGLRSVRMGLIGDYSTMGFFESWSGLPRWLRVGMALIFLAVSTVLFFRDRFWPYGWAIGGILLIFSGPSDSEKKGYHF